MDRNGLVVHAVLVVALTAIGCQTSHDGAPNDAVGGLGLKLSCPPDVTIDSVSYAITGPHAYSKTGMIPLDGMGSTFGARVDGIPAVAGYTLTLDASEHDGGKCSGTAAFDVAASCVTAVTVRLQCPGHKSGSVGSILVDGTVNICAAIQSATATQTDSNHVSLHGSATDDDPGPSTLTYAWTTSSGAALGSDADLTLDCSALDSSASVVLTVSDGDCGDDQTVSNPCADTSPPSLTCSDSGDRACSQGDAATIVSVPAAMPDAGIDAGSDASMAPMGTCIATGGDMNESRVRAGAQPLPDGRVLIAGGIDTKAGHVLASAELYDPATDQFFLADAMSTPRAAFSMVALPDGRVIAIGGIDDKGSPLASAEIYDLDTGTWTPTGAMSTGRARHSAIALSDGRVLVVGGFDKTSWIDVTATTFGTGTPIQTAELYDPASNTFALVGSMTTPRAGAGVSLLPNSDVIIVGGAVGVGPTPLGGGAAPPVFTGSAETYTANASGAASFQAAGSAPGTVLSSGSAFPLRGGTVLVTSPSVSIFDPVARTFTAAASELMALSTAGTRLSGGDIFFSGLQSDEPSIFSEVYQASTGTWRSGPALITARSVPAIADLGNGTVLVAGGCTTSACGASVIASAEVCKP